MRLIEDIKHNLAEGFGNGYRPCCIAFFALAWNPVMSDIRPVQRWYNRMTWRRIPVERPTTQVQYVPCPLCLVRGSFDYDESQPHLDISREDLEDMMASMDDDDPMNLLFPEEDPF